MWQMSVDKVGSTWPDVAHWLCAVGDHQLWLKMCEQQHVTSFILAASDAMLRQCQQEQVPETASDEI